MMSEVEYAGFWIRTGAAIIDSVLVVIVLIPIILLIYGADTLLSGMPTDSLSYLLLNYVLPAAAVIIFWVYKSATPGKMALGLTIVDAKTGGKPSTGQFIGRYLGYYVSMLPFFLGIIWVALDRRKQGWHDKLAGTVVIRRHRDEPVSFETDSTA